MSKGMNKLLRQMLNYDLGSGILISLLIVLFSSFVNSMIYFLGIVVGLVNFICSCFVTEKFLFKEGANGTIALLITIVRIMGVVIVAVPLVNNVTFISFYLAGFISHHVILGSSCVIKNRKGSV